MNWKRVALATAAAFGAAFVFDILWNAIVLRSVYTAHAELWRPAAELNRMVPLGWAAMLVMTATAGIAFVRLGGRGIRKGLEFACWLAAGSVAGALGIGTLAPWPAAILWGMAVQSSFHMLAVGFAFGRLYRDKASGEETGDTAARHVAHPA